MQFGGASGNGYMTEQQLEQGTVELKQFGRFEKGVFRRNEDVEGKRNVDGYQAVWEHVHQRPMKYPEPRYHDPVMIEPSHFEWVAVEGVRGVSEKLMGVFTERRTHLRQLRLEPQARYRVDGRAAFFVLAGTGQVDAEAYRAHTTVFCDHGEEASFVATTPTDILVLGLPTFAAAVPQQIAAE
jgi:hypothetical protein